MAEQQVYIYIIRMTRPDMANKPSAEERRTMETHFDHLQSKLASGELLLAGPALDSAFGIVIFTAPDEAAARAFMESDPAVQQGIMQAELHPFKVSLLGDQWRT